jgi:hypothetical protein
MVSSLLYAEGVDDKLLSGYSEGPADGYSWKQREINYDKSNNYLTKDKLISTIWVNQPQLGYHSSKLLFFKDNVFKMGTNQTGVKLIGSYEISEDGKLILNTIDSNLKTENSILFGDSTTAEFRLELDTKNFWLTHKLINTENTIEWFAMGSEPELDDIFLIDGVEVLRKQGQYTVKENVKFRTGPSITNNTIELNTYITEPINFQLTYLPVGEKVYLLAETKENHKIEDWEAPWCYVRYSVYHGYITGWVYGEFITTYQESEKESYKRLNNEEWKKILSR